MEPLDLDGGRLPNAKMQRVLVAFARQLRADNEDIPHVN
jgi:hypothetical protein